MSFIKPPKFKIKNLLLLIILLAISALISVVGKLMSNKTQSPIAQAQSCWTPPVPGGESSDSQASVEGVGPGESAASDAVSCD